MNNLWENHLYHLSSSEVLLPSCKVVGASEVPAPVKTAVVNSKSIPTPNPVLRTRSMTQMSSMLQTNPGVRKPT